MDTDQRPTPRKRSRRGPRCIRDGCERTQAKGNRHCSYICQLLDVELVRLERVCRQAGPGTRSTEAWTALVEIADAWSEYVKTRGILNHIADRAQSLALAGSATTDAAAGGVEKDPPFMPVSRPRRGNFGGAASGSRRGRLGRPPGSAETAEQRR